MKTVHLLHNSYRPSSILWLCILVFKAAKLICFSQLRVDLFSTYLCKFHILVTLSLLLKLGFSIFFTPFSASTSCRSNLGTLWAGPHSGVGFNKNFTFWNAVFYRDSFSEMQYFNRDFIFWNAIFLQRFILLNATFLQRFKPQKSLLLFFYLKCHWQMGKVSHKQMYNCSKLMWKII